MAELSFREHFEQREMAKLSAKERQQREALAKANRVRLARADLKRRVREGELTVADLLLNHRETCTSMTLEELLRSQRRWGKTRSRKLLAQVDMGPMKQIGSLTKRQRWLLIGKLGVLPKEDTEEKRPG